jgi:nucleotide-binding universal stress UspA family protein
MPLATAESVELRNILVATDFSAASAPSIHQALALARRHHARVCLTHVVSALSFTLVGPDAVDLAVSTAARDIHELERQLLASGELSGLRHKAIVCHGIVWQELERLVQEEGADLLVVGTHARQGLRKLALGSVAEEIFRHATCPVLTVGPGAEDRFPVETEADNGPVLLATDFGAASRSALGHAISFANEQKVQLVLVHIIPPYTALDNPFGFPGLDAAHLQDQARAEDLRRIQEMLPLDEPMAREPRYVVEFGVPAPAILATAAAAKAQLIVMGLNRPARLSAPSHFPWAVAYEVVCGAQCPVLTIRETT